MTHASTPAPDPTPTPATSDTPIADSITSQPETQPLVDVPPTVANPVVPDTVSQPAPPPASDASDTTAAGSDTVSDQLPASQEPSPAPAPESATVTVEGEDYSLPEQGQQNLPYSIGSNGLPNLEAGLRDSDTSDCIIEFLQRQFGYAWDLHQLTYMLRKNMED